MSGLGVQPHGGLVENQDPGLVDQAPGYKQAPLHATGKLFDLGLLPLSQLTTQQYTIHNFYDSPGFINLPHHQYFVSLSQRVHHQPPANYHLLKIISAGPQLDYEETHRVFTNPTLKIYEKVI